MKSFTNIQLYIRRATFSLYALLVVIMAVATVAEENYGTPWAHQHIYEAWWFLTLWGVALLGSLSCLPIHLKGIGRWFKHLPTKLSRRSSAIIVAIMLSSSMMAANCRVVEKVQADSMSSQQVIYNGRICPLNTPARDFLLKLTGKSSYKGLTAEQVALSWTLYPEDWKDVKMIHLKKAEVSQRLGIHGDDASFADFFDKQGNYRLPLGLYPDIDERLTLIVLLTRGKLFEPLPQEVPSLSNSRIKAELIYNAVPWDTILFIASFIMAFLLFFVKTYHPQWDFWKVGKRSIKCLLALFLLVSLGIRWYISDHIPVSNTYETLLVIALTALIISCFTHQHDIPALIVAGSTLLVAHIGALDPQVTTLVPILQSPWLSSHVTTIMISYCLFAMLLFRPNRTMLIWAEVLLATGIVLGSIWAKTAWGTYWSWDPKETWALISLIVYMYPLHTATLPWFRSEQHQKWYLRVAFLTILMTYFGCNYLLTGMHSYK